MASLLISSSDYGMLQQVMIVNNKCDIIIHYATVINIIITIASIVMIMIITIASIIIITIKSL